MTSIKDIDYNEILQLLKSNGIKVPSDKDKAYQLAFDLIKSGKDYQAPDQIYLWILAYNAVQSNIDVNDMATRRFYNLSKDKKEKLSESLGLEKYNTNDLITILYYMDKLESKSTYPLIDFSIVARVYSKAFANALKDNRFIRIVDVNAYLLEGYDYPDISSIFYDGSAGSYDYVDSKKRRLDVHHGTLSAMGKFNFDFGDKYYLAKYGKELQHDDY